MGAPTSRIYARLRAANALSDGGLCPATRGECVSATNAFGDGGHPVPVPSQRPNGLNLRASQAGAHVGWGAFSATVCPFLLFPLLIWTTCMENIMFKCNVRSPLFCLVFCFCFSGRIDLLIHPD